mmetsp:Transcript_27580/g.68563  ORF Transcript_27580/g.68563 Transcript_27580/m.68563 type:complete len:207 (-) Transcript_27580:613-1233(-)
MHVMAAERYVQPAERLEVPALCWSSHPPLTLDHLQQETLMEEATTGAMGATTVAMAMQVAMLAATRAATRAVVVGTLQMAKALVGTWEAVKRAVAPLTLLESTTADVGCTSATRVTVRQALAVAAGEVIAGVIASEWDLMMIQMGTPGALAQMVRYSSRTTQTTLPALAPTTTLELPRQLIWTPTQRGRTPRAHQPFVRSTRAFSA